MFQTCFAFANTESCRTFDGSFFFCSSSFLFSLCQASPYTCTIRGSILKITALHIILPFSLKFVGLLLLLCVYHNHIPCTAISCLQYQLCLENFSFSSSSLPIEWDQFDRAHWPSQYVWAFPYHLLHFLFRWIYIKSPSISALCTVCFIFELEFY